MSDFELEILRYIRDAGPSVLWWKVFNAFDPAKRIFDTDAILKKLLKDKFIEKTSQTDKPPHCSIRISDEGRVLLLREEEKAQKLKLLQEEEKKQKQDEEDKRNNDTKKERRFSVWFSVISSILTRLIDAIPLDFGRIIALIRSLF